MAIDLSSLELAMGASCSENQRQWFFEKRLLLSNSDNLLDDLLIPLAMAKRKVGNNALAIDANSELNAHSTSRWSSDEAARVLLIAAAQQREPDSSGQLVEVAFQQGDEYEREAILKGLPLLDSSGGLLNLAVEACRTNIVTLFTAISQRNSYPAQYFDEAAFNQMVLKSLFLDLDIDAIAGLQERVNASMSRMCYDYLRERTAANRAVPCSIWLALNLQWTPQAVETFIDFLNDKNTQQRFYLALSISRQSVPPKLKQAISARITVETNPEIQRLLERSLS